MMTFSRRFCFGLTWAVLLSMSLAESSLGAVSIRAHPATGIPSGRQELISVQDSPRFPALQQGDRREIMNALRGPFKKEPFTLQAGISRPHKFLNVNLYGLKGVVYKFHVVLLFTPSFLSIPPPL